MRGKYFAFDSIFQLVNSCIWVSHLNCFDISSQGRKGEACGHFVEWLVDMELSPIYWSGVLGRGSAGAASDV